MCRALSLWRAESPCLLSIVSPKPSIRHGPQKSGTVCVDIVESPWRMQLHRKGTAVWQTGCGSQWMCRVD